MKKVFLSLLTKLARTYLRRYRPQIVAITGNTGKTSTKEAIASVLRQYKKIRMSVGNLNNEWGVPLTILGEWGKRYYEEGGTAGLWLAVLAKAATGLFWRQDYPEILILEYGADRPGDIKKLVKNFPPQMAVVTAVGEIPVHVEYFSSPEHLTKEKARLVDALPADGFAVLNADDFVVLEMKEKTLAKICTFGFSEGATVRTSNFELRTDAEGKPLGVGFKLHYGESFVPCRINGSLGKSQCWAAAAAGAVGLIFGLNLVQISEALEQHVGPAGRLKILKGIKGTTIIDDTYNASPASTHLALETLKQLSASRKIAVLGDMLELGKYTVETHQQAGNFAATAADILITVGDKTKFVAAAAANQLPRDRIFSFHTSDEAKITVQEMLQPGDLVLIKGSQGMRMEKIVEEIMAEPEKKKTLLVRQSKKWLNK